MSEQVVPFNLTHVGTMHSAEHNCTRYIFQCDKGHRFFVEQGATLPMFCPECGPGDVHFTESRKTTFPSSDPIDVIKAPEGYRVEKFNTSPCTFACTILVTCPNGHSKSITLDAWPLGFFDSLHVSCHECGPSFASSFAKATEDKSEDKAAEEEGKTHDGL